MLTHRHIRALLFCFAASALQAARMHGSAGGRAHYTLGIHAIAHADHLQSNVATLLHNTMHFLVGRGQEFTSCNTSGLQEVCCQSTLSSTKFKTTCQAR